MTKVGFVSLGCPKNLVDSEVMLGMLREAGHTVTADRNEADVIVVNTCSFIEGSKRESIETILEMAELKKNGNCKRLIVTGCLAERYPGEIQQDLAEVDAILGTNQLVEITRAVAGEPTAPPNSFGRSDADLYLYDDRTPRILTTPTHSAYMKIAEGCDHTCAFCIIPKIRGRFRSRSIPSLVREAEVLADRGVKEINLVSQDTTSYGTDLGFEEGLARLLEALEGVNGIQWIRCMYIYPTMVSDRLLGVMAASQKVCKYVDMPLQHVSRNVLKAMRRGGDRRSLARLVGRIRRGVPGVAFRTTMMVGFPGETESEFRELLEFCADMEFDRLGVFAYSAEEGTAAVGLADSVPRPTAERRRKELMKQQASIASRKNRDLVGKEFLVLVEGPSDESEFLLQGRLETQAPEIDGVCLINDSCVDAVKPGEFRTFRITRALQHDFLGTLVR